MKSIVAVTIIPRPSSTKTSAFKSCNAPRHSVTLYRNSRWEKAALNPAPLIDASDANLIHRM